MIMRRLLTGILMLVPGLIHAAAPVPAEIVPERIPGARPRNVVFILSDDHRHDAMGFLGHPFATTPAMDSMAANGAHVKNALVTTSLCSPSRASILTGLYTFRHRVIDNNRPIPAGTVYFPQYLQKAGYATNPKYAERLTALIETENLHRFDRGAKQFARARASR